MLSKYYRSRAAPAMVVLGAQSFWWQSRHFKRKPSFHFEHFKLFEEFEVIVVLNYFISFF